MSRTRPAMQEKKSCMIHSTISFGLKLYTHFKKVMQFQLCTFCLCPQHRFSSSPQCHHQSFAIKSVLLLCSIQVDFSIFPLNISQKSFHRPQDICAVRASCTVAAWRGRTSYERCSGTLEARRSFAEIISVLMSPN